MNRLLKLATCAATLACVALPTAASAQYGYGYRYRGGGDNAVSACARFAQRYGGRVRITDVDRRYDRFRVHGVIQGSRWGYDRYDRYDDRYGRYDDRYDRYDDRYGGSDRYGYGYGRGYGRPFSCTATDYGRVTDFDLNGRDRY